MTRSAFPSQFQVYFHPEDWMGEVLNEQKERGIHPFFSWKSISFSQEIKKPFWVVDHWVDASLFRFESITEAARFLKSLPVKKWSPLAFDFHRRTQLLSEKINTPRLLTLSGPAFIPQDGIGSFFLLDENTLIYTLKLSAPVPGGLFRFQEEKSGPPSRAYLKLWEALSRFGELPKPGDLTLDLGSCPGGWTYVLSRLGATVVSVDGANLDPAVLKMTGVHYLKKDAFKLKPEEVLQISGSNETPLGWFFSDMICDPDRVESLLEPWLKLNPRPHFIITLKFKGKTDLKSCEKLARIPGAEIIHLSQNKHELCFILH